MKKTIIASLFVCVLAQFLWAQDQPVIDSLKQVLAASSAQRERADVLVLLAAEYVNTDSAQAVQFAQQAITLAKTQDYPQAIARAYVQIGWANLRTGHYDSAEVYYDRALALSTRHNDTMGKADAYHGLATAKSDQGDFIAALQYGQNSLRLRQEMDDKKGMALSYNQLGITSAYQGEYPKSLDFFLKALSVREEINDRKGMAGNYNNIAILYENMNDNEKATEYYFKALEINKSFENLRGVAINYNNLGSIYRRENLYEQAIEYTKKSLEINENINNPMGQASNLGTLGQLYEKLQNYPKAIEYLQKSTKLREETGLTSEAGRSYNQLSNLYTQLKEHNQAIALAEKAKSIALTNGDTEMLQAAAYHLSENYAAIQNYRKAYEAHVLFQEVKDSLFNESNTREFTRLEAEYEFQKTKDSIQVVQNQERLLFAEERKRKETEQLAMLVGLILVSSLGGVIFYFFVEKQKNNLRLTATNADLAEANEQLYIANEELKTAQEETQSLNESLQQTLELVELQRDELNTTLAVVREQKEKITDSINYGQRIQKAMLPNDATFQAAFPESFVLLLPRDVVSGDFYWFSDLRNSSGKLFLAAVDCTGHGVPGAFMSMIAHNLLNSIVNEKRIDHPSRILENLHADIRSALNQAANQNRDGMDMSLVVWDTERNVLQFAGAKNPLVYIQENQLHYIKGDRKPIGGEQREGQRTFTTHEISLAAPTTFYLYSDGYQDQFGGEKNTKFLSSRFRELLFHIHALPLPEQKQQLTQTLTQWKGSEEQVDDILVIGVKVSS